MSIKSFYSILGNCLKCAIVAHCINEYVGNIVLCAGPSMEPTLWNNDVLIAERITVRLKKFKKGDIMISQCPSNADQYICKRITGLPGDRVKHGIVVPSEHIWLEGDNAYNSTDSRTYGPVPVHFLRARVLCKIVPSDDISGFIRKLV